MSGPLRIATDDAWGPGGIGTFGHHVLQGLEAYGHEIDRLSTVPRASMARVTPLRPLAITAGLHDRRHDLFFSPGFYPPLRWSGPAAVTVHDLHYLDPAVSPSRPRRWYFRHALLPLIRRCDLVLTVSEESRASLTDALGGSADIVVVGEGVAEDYFLAGKARQEPEAERAGPLRITYIGNWLAHKRAALMMSALALAGRSTPIELSVPDDMPGHIEALAGADRGADSTHTLRLRKRPPLATRDLADHLAASDLCVLLSSHEGFGLPPLEAQAARTPALVARFEGAAARFGVQGAHYVDLDAGPGEVAVKLVQLATNPTLRRSTVEAGLANAETRRWTDVVHRVDAALTGLVS